MTVSTAVTPVEAANTAALAGSTVAPSAHDMSFMSLIFNADPLVMVIMFILIAMSVTCWAIILDKFNAMRSLTERTNNFENEFWQADALDKFYERVKKRKAKHPISVMFSAAMDEWLRSKAQDRVVPRGGASGELQVSVKERIMQMMTVARNRELDRLERGLGFLATAGSASPFIGLLGTCIGIMNSFRAIAGSQNTSLAVVAPGIAEALLATSIGLFVAIPAVVAYNRFNGEINRLAGRMEDFATEFEALLSRQTDQNR
ncbi:MAG: protein TolQ [Alphaproteobacteria bacterium]|nr:protein TolQ [Alphaproteobacteria bacterium]